MAKKSTATEKKKSVEKRESQNPTARKTNPETASPSTRSVTRSKSIWSWEVLAGVIGEKCYRSDDFTHTEVGRWWYDIMASTQKYRCKAGNVEKSAATPDDAREAVLSALTNLY
jgi:hypothetical protein